MDTTYDEARRCYRCGELGKQVGVKLAQNRRMGSIHTYRCQNARCVGFERDWIIQVRPDGTIPTATKDREKSFPIDAGSSNRQRIDAARRRADETLNQSLER